MGNRPSCTAEPEPQITTAKRSSCLEELTDNDNKKCIFKDCKNRATSTKCLDVIHSPGYDHPPQVTLHLCVEHSNITEFHVACNCTHSVDDLPERFIRKPKSKKYEYVIIYKNLMCDPDEIITRPNN